MESIIEAPARPSGLKGSREGRIWRWATLLLALAVVMPLLVLATAWFSDAQDVWTHLQQTVLGDLLRNTAVLMLGVGAGVVVLGVGMAWLTSMCEFPGRHLFDWALMLPLAVPAYVLAFVFLGLLDFTGPVQTGLRDLGLRWFPEVRSAGGVIAVMTLVLYPYVYMLTRVAFLGQGHSAIEAGRVLGLGPWGAFLRVALPMARPGIMAGLALALMETLADFGAVSVFNFDTSTTAIYKAWFGLFNLQAAAQLASLLLLFVAVALFIERYLRGRARYHGAESTAAGRRFRLRGWRAWAATGAASLVLGLAFAVPVGQLLVWAWSSVGDLDQRYVGLLEHTLFLGAMAALATVLGAFLLGYTRRHHGDRLTRTGVQLATLGYALPGSVLAVGIMISLTWVDHRIDGLVEQFFGVSLGLLLSGSLVALMLAYVVRFLAVAYGPVESSLERIRPVLRDAGRSLGAGSWEIIRRVYIPMLRPGLLTAALLVLVDVMKDFAG